MRRLLPILLLALPALAQEPCLPVAEPREVRPGDSVLLSWDCAAAKAVRLEPGGLVLPGKGRVTLRPTYTTTYRLFESRGGGRELGAVEVRIVPGLPLGEPARICSFDASAAAVLPGEPVVLRWECAGSAKVRLEPGGLELDGKSEVTVTPLENTRYTLVASNAAGGASRSLDVAVLRRLDQLPAALSCTFTADKRSVQPGEQVTLKWQCNGDAKVRLEPGGLELDGQTSVAVLPERTTVYTLNVTNSVGGISRSLEITVQAPRKVIGDADVGSAVAPAPLAAPEERLRVLQEGDLAEALRLGQLRRAEAPADAWTLRLVVSGFAPGLKTLARLAPKEAADMMILPYVRKDGFRWWQACWGAYKGRAEALRAWSGVPEPLRKAFGEPLPLKLRRLPGDPPLPLNPEGK
ncbi:MAG: hypothetical protein HY823_01390 [Acidobacteria bacterium]|nr:hypothetical protein [Acidobacteriota bacterium]